MTQTVPHATAMLASHPIDHGIAGQRELAACINACFDCAQTCTTCADACLAEETVAELRACIRTNLDCADICDVTGRMLSRYTGADVELLQATVRACAVACELCAVECRRHAGRHEHCRVCAEACESCAAACKAVLEQLR